jgi:hypothetical protein
VARGQPKRKEVRRHAARLLSDDPAPGDDSSEMVRMSCSNEKGECRGLNPSANESRRIVSFQKVPQSSVKDKNWVLKDERRRKRAIEVTRRLQLHARNGRIMSHPQAYWSGPLVWRERGNAKLQPRLLRSGGVSKGFGWRDGQGSTGVPSAFCLHPSIQLRQK